MLGTRNADSHLKSIRNGTFFIPWREEQRRTIHDSERGGDFWAVLHATVLPSLQIKSPHVYWPKITQVGDLKFSVNLWYFKKLGWFMPKVSECQNQGIAPSGLSREQSAPTLTWLLVSTLRFSLPWWWVSSAPRHVSLPGSQQWHLGSLNLACICITSAFQHREFSNLRINIMRLNPPSQSKTLS